MHFLDHPGLSRLSALLKELDVGDRILSGRLELFSTRAAPSKVELEPPNEAELLSRAAPFFDAASPSPPFKKQRFDSDGSHTTGQHPAWSGSPSASPPLQPSSGEVGHPPDTIAALGHFKGNDGVDANHATVAASEQQLPEKKRPRALSTSSADSEETPLSGMHLETASGGNSTAPRTLNRTRRSSSVSSASSFLGTQTPEQARRLLVQLVTTLNACFPHYDFSSVGPDAFAYVEDFVSVYTAINYHLSFLAEAVIPGFLQDLWSVIKDAVDLREVAIYSYSNTQGQVESDPYLDDEGCLFSFDYFFVDARHQKILFFSCMTKQKMAASLREGWAEGYDSALSPTTSISSVDEHYKCAHQSRWRERSYCRPKTNDFASVFVAVSSSDFIADDVKDEDEDDEE